MADTRVRAKAPDLEKMADTLRKAGWQVIPPDSIVSVQKGGQGA